jgi:hypothetical protein
VVPWLDQPATMPSLPDVDRPVTHPVLYRLCSAVDLKASANGWGAGMGTASQDLTFTNASLTSCTLVGGPVAFTYTDPDGVLHRVKPKADAGFGMHLDAVANLRPGESAKSNVWLSDECPAFMNQKYVPRFSVELPDTTAVTIIVPGGHYEVPPDGCPFSASWFGTPHVTVPQPSYPLDPLKATMQLPATLPAGQTFSYVVTVTNPTSTPIPLSPCPAYDEGWKPTSSDALLHRVYRLNCAAHPVVQAHETVAYAMRMVAPTRLGQDPFWWMLQPSNGVSAGDNEATVVAH